MVVKCSIHAQWWNNNAKWCQLQQSKLLEEGTMICPAVPISILHGSVVDEIIETLWSMHAKRSVLELYNCKYYHKRLVGKDY